MERQHRQIAHSIEQVMTALPECEASTTIPARERLVAVLEAHRAALGEHLDDDEARLLPLASRYLTQSEWNALGEHFVRTTPKSQLLIVLGAVLEDADPAEQSSPLTAMPVMARIIWRGAVALIDARQCGRPAVLGDRVRGRARVR